MGQITLSRVKERMFDLAPVAGGAILSVAISKMLSKFLSSKTVVNGLGASTTQTLKDFAVPVATTVIGCGISIGAEGAMAKKFGNGIAVGGLCDVASRLLWSKSLTQSLSGGIMGSLIGDDDDLDGLGDPDEDFGDIDDLDGINGEDPIRVENEVGDINDSNDAVAALDIPIPSGLTYSRYDSPIESIEGLEGELIL